MTIAQWMLLAFALWTILVPLGAVGLHRLGQVLTGRAAMNAFPADDVKGPDWYRRAMRAHAAREGLNLQNHCADLFHFDIPWNPARMEQLG